MIRSSSRLSSFFRGKAHLKTRYQCSRSRHLVHEPLGRVRPGSYRRRASALGSTMRSPAFLALLHFDFCRQRQPGGADTPHQIYRVGVLSTGPEPTDQSPFGAGLIRGFARHGLVLGKNLAFERRAAHGKLDSLPELLDELVASKVAIVIASGYPASLAAKRHTSLPVVVVRAGDPVEDGLVASFSRPGGHVTGLSEIAAEAVGQAPVAAERGGAERAPGSDAVERRGSWHVVALQGGGSAGARPRPRRRIARRACARNGFDEAFASDDEQAAGRDPDGQRRADDLEPQACDRLCRRAQDPSGLRIRLRWCGKAG